MAEIRLHGKVIISAEIVALTGIRVGGSQTGLKIGGPDSPVISDAYGVPYIPGSALRGKMLTLTERKLAKPPSQHGGRHMCSSGSLCEVCKIWGVLGVSGSANGETVTLGRLLVRDVPLDQSTITPEMQKNMDLKYTEVKFETAIDRRTGTALHGSLRQIERVPAGAIFRPAEFIFNIYEDGDKDLLKHLFEAMALLEDDYLGGMGSRGYGKVKFENIRVWWNKKEDYEKGNLGLTAERAVNKTWTTPRELINNFAELKKGLTG
ncbi:MAG: type III-A CRISPR-associated RAMP protein Csm3 [candidate division WOR-3 bacterium]